MDRRDNFDLSAHKQAEQHGAATEPSPSRDTTPSRVCLTGPSSETASSRSCFAHNETTTWSPPSLVDLDNFRSINEHLGQEAGDELLKAVANRLMGVLRACDTIGRPSGDEFAILADGLSLSGGPELLAERLLDALREPFHIEGFDDIPLSVTASIGIATNEGDEPDD